MDQRVEQAQRLFWEIERLRQQGACRLITRKLLEMARLHESRARELLAQHDPDGWIDWYAAITARAESGCLVEASGFVREGRALAAFFPEGRANIEGQLDDLETWVRSLQVRVVPALGEYARQLPALPAEAA